MRTVSSESRTTILGGAGRAVRYAILGVLVSGVRRRDPSAVVNAVVSFCGTYLPAIVEWRYDTEFRPWQRLYLNVGMLTHAVGMLGPYDDTWWWDHVTHTHSSTLVGGLIHVVARRGGRDPRPRVLGGVLLVGLLWELMEYVVHGVSRRVGLEPLLVPYGTEDTLRDLLFDVLGAILVLAAADPLLSNLTSDDPE